MAPPPPPSIAFSVPHPSPIPTRRKAPRCAINPRESSPHAPTTTPAPTHETPQPHITETPRHHPHVPRLRLLKLSLLLSDLHFRVNTHHSHPSLHPPLSSISTLSTALLNSPPPPPAAVRQALWDLREALEPFPVSDFTRESLELARACALHVPKAQRAELDRELHTLSMETRLLQELKGLRAMVVDFLSSVPLGCDKSKVLSMAAQLGIDEYRVRGKTRLSNAVLELTTGETALPDDFRHAAARVRAVLENSLAEDLQTSPAGEAMLLRPRVVDIPNFAVVTENFLRGGQPNRGGLDWLRQYGVALVVDLRGTDRGNMWIPPCRFLPSSSSGPEIRLCNIPIEDFCTPSLEQVQEFLALVERFCGRGDVVFVHCKAGIGRTGTLVACWRVSRGMDVEEALAMERLYSEGGGGLRQEDFVREFARKWKER